MATPASTKEALEAILGGLGYLAAVDPAALATEAQAECLQIWSMPTRSPPPPERGSGRVHRGAGHAEDADYSPTSWLIRRTRITKAAARGHLGWSRRVVTHPQILAAMAEGSVLP